MPTQPHDLDEEAYGKVFDFFVGFLLIPFIVFILITTVNLVLEPKSITDGMAIIYIALLTGIYYTITKKTTIYLSNSPVSFKNKFRILGLLAFSLPFISFWLNSRMNLNRENPPKVLEVRIQNPGLDCVTAECNYQALLKERGEEAVKLETKLQASTTRP